MISENHNEFLTTCVMIDGNNIEFLATCGFDFYVLLPVYGLEDMTLNDICYNLGKLHQESHSKSPNFA